MYWIEFVISTVIIVFAGVRLTTAADKLCDERQLGKAWIGVIVLGVVTSLPEAVTSLVSVIFLNANDLAVGNLLGSNNINPMIIVMMDAVYRREAITNSIQPSGSHKVSAQMAIILALIVMADIGMSRIFPMLRVGPISAGSFLIVVIYFLGMRRLAELSIEEYSGPLEQKLNSETTAPLHRWVQLLVSAVLVIVGSMWLAKSADVIAEQTGLGGTFFGSIFLAFVTSLPEIVVSLSALRMGSLDLAVGNIFGSNMTNIFILFVCGLFHRGGAILGAVSQAHLITAGLSVVLTFVAIKGIFTRNKKSICGLGADSILMIFIFMLGTGILYVFKP